jgi:hypothetical protein
MAKTTNTKIDYKEEVEQTINVFQVCNELKISGLSREYVQKRFKDEEKTLTEWKESFKKVRLDF